MFGLRSLTAARRKSLPAASGDGASDRLPVRAGEENALLEGAEMSFIDHLEELRWRIIKGLGGIVIATIACGFFADWVVDTLLLGPTKAEFFMYDVLGLESVRLQLQNRTLPGQFFAYWGTVFVVGLILGSPTVLYQAWKFVEPGLYPRERKGLRFAAAFATFFFMLGIAFGYLILTPIAVQFFAQFSISDQIVNEIDVTKFFSMVTTFALGTGVLFELPVVIYLLARIGVVNAEMLRKYRKYALIIILVIAAIVTPPDPISQIITAIPLLLLYELSIWLASIAARKHQKSVDDTLE